LEQANWRMESIFGSLSPLGAPADKTQGYKFFEKSDNFGPPDTWLQILLETSDIFDIMGIILGAWKRGKGFKKALAESAASGCKVRVLLLHKENTCLLGLTNENIPEEGDLRTIVNEIDEMYMFFSDFAEKNKNIKVRQIEHGCPHFQMTRNDKRAVHIQYLFSQKTGWSPLWQSDHGSPLYNIVSEEFETLWQVNI
jgi:hypothetical protein